MSIVFNARAFAVVSALSVSTFLSTDGFAQQPDSDKRTKIMERVTVIGSEDRREEIPGAATLVSKETFERYQFTDVHRALREVPGVSVQEEDGHGLRPNIAIRGGRSNRSADITLMEDGVLAAPAPYAAPEAYYFPQMDRMESLEVIKGVGSIQYGPRTTNGVLNMITKPIPSKTTADVLTEFGTDQTYRTGLTTGTTTENTGILLNAFHKQTDGFKDIDSVGGGTGYNVEDVLGKIRLNTGANRDRYQEIELKVGYYDEVSNETYLGLTDADFALNPFRRYASSQMDQMDVSAWQTALTHFAELSDTMDLTTTVYHNAIDRTWYRLNGARVGGVRRDIGVIFSDPAANVAYIDALKSANTTGGTFVQRDNARDYFAQGIQSKLGYDYTLGETQNHVDVGLRIHRDEEDRFQREDTFDLVNGRAQVSSSSLPGAGGNRVQSAQAWSSFVQNELSWGRVTVTPGIRFEHINLKREDYGSSDPNRTGSALARFENSLNVWIPGVGASYALSENWKLLGGVHKGFAPPGVPGSAGEAAFTREEESVNYEIGTRYKKDVWAAELFGFVTKYENLIGRDTFSAGGGGTGDAFNGGNVDVHGIEATVQYDAAPILGFRNDYRVPLTANYTRTEGEFKNSFVSGFEEWGTVTSGDELPYLPENQFYLSAGFETSVWGVSAGAKYVGEMRTKAGSGPIPESRLVESHWTVDVAGDYAINERVKLFTTVENIFDEEYVAARRPAGARPGMPMTAMVGLKVALW